MTTNVEPQSSPIPTIAIHGVGKHEPGQIERKIRETLGSVFRLSVSEFNWDQHVENGSWASPKSAYENLQNVSADVYTTAIAGLSIVQSGLDARLSDTQLKCCNLLRHLIAVGLSSVIAIPAIVIIIFLPTQLLQIGPVFPVEEVRRFASWFIPFSSCLIAFLFLSILVLGLVRAVIQGSLAPFVSAITCVVLICLNPFVVFLGIPLSVSWVHVGFTVGFFCIFGLFISVLELFLPDVPAYTVWRGFVVAPYLLFIIGGLIFLQCLRSFFARFWHESFIKVLLDIARYVGEPFYRMNTLSHLDDFIHSKQRRSNNLVILGHSLGSIIALDYLLNRCDGDSRRCVWLITLGSPYRRFFLRWLPGILFNQSTNQTAASIKEKFRAFYWLNVFRPWDYIGKSLNLEAHAAGLDQSTGQYWRVNGHSDYWSDDAVLAAVKQALPSIPQPVAQDVYLGQHCIPKANEPATSQKRSIPMNRLALILTGLGIVWMVYACVDRNAEMARTRAAIDESGIHLRVQVSHRIIPDVASEVMYAHEFEFIGEGLEMPPYQLSPYLPASTAQQRFDFRTLEAFVRDDCELERPARWFEDERSIKCTSKRTTEIAYLPPANSLRFYLPAFQPRFYLRDFFEWFFYPLVTIAFLSFFAFPFVALASVSYAVFLGREPGISEMDLIDSG